MKVKLGVLVDSKEALGALLMQPVTTGMRHKIKRVVKAVTAELQTFEESRVELVKKLGTPVAGDKYELKGESKIQFYKDLNELRETEIELAVDPIQETDIWSEEEQETSKFPTAYSMALDWLIKDGTEGAVQAPAEVPNTDAPASDDDDPLGLGATA